MPEIMEDPTVEGDLMLPPLDSAADPDVTDVEVISIPTSKDEGTPGGWVVIPTTPKPEGAVWHYTDGGGAIGILRSRVLWATSIGSLNDAMEFQYGLAQLGDLLADVRASRHIHPLQKRFVEEVHAQGDEARGLSPLFVLCASEDGDSLSQWRGYGGSVGHAIGLDPAARPAVLDESQPTTRHTGDSVLPAWGRVLYRPDEQRDFLLRTLSFIAQQCPLPESYEADAGEAVPRAVPWLLAALAYCKHPSFADEREVRLVLQAGNVQCMAFRATRFGVTPYIPVTFTEGQQSFLPRTVPKAEHLPLAAVAIGPTAHGSTAADGMRLLLRGLGHPEVAVTETQAPFR